MKVNILIKAIYAGILIGLAGVVYLSVDNQYLGALLFSFGLLGIVTNGYYLYTGKVGYLVKEKKFVIVLLITILGNLLGTSFVALLVGLVNQSLVEKASSIVLTKLSKDIFTILTLSFFCGMLMYLAVEGFRRTKNEIAKVLIVIFPVMIFILSKFEHSVANMVYFGLVKSFDFKTLLYLGCMLIGNGLGAFLLGLLDLIIETKEKMKD